MKLTKSQRKALTRKFRPSWTQENLLTLAFKNQVKSQLYKRIKEATSVEEVDQIINDFTIEPVLPSINSLTNSIFAKSNKEFDLVLSALIKNPKDKKLNLRSAGLLQSRRDFAPYLEMFKHNVSLIQDLPRELARKLKQAYMTGTAFRGTAFARELTEKLGKRARLLIRTESSKITSTLTQARMQKLGLNAYIWSTSEDSRVRSAHYLLDGVLVFWNDPPTIDNYRNHCGRFVNCRCIPLPITSIDDIQFPVYVAESVNIQTTYVKSGRKGVKGKTESKVVSGAIMRYTKEKFIEKFGNLFT